MNSQLEMLYLEVVNDHDLSRWRGNNKLIFRGQTKNPTIHGCNQGTVSCWGSVQAVIGEGATMKAGR